MKLLIWDDALGWVPQLRAMFRKWRNAMKYLKYHLALMFVLALAANAQTPIPTDNRCAVASYRLGCNYVLYPGGQAGISFTPGYDPAKELSAYQGPSYVPNFLATDFGNLNYTPQNIRWTQSGSFINLDFTDSLGSPAHVVFVWKSGKIGRIVSTAWWVTEGTSY